MSVSGPQNDKKTALNFLNTALDDFNANLTKIRDLTLRGDYSKEIQLVKIKNAAIIKYLEKLKDNPDEDVRKKSSVVLNEVKQANNLMPALPAQPTPTSNQAPPRPTQPLPPPLRPSTPTPTLPNVASNNTSENLEKAKPKEKKPSFFQKHKGKIIGGLVMAAFVAIGVGITVATMGAALPLVVAAGVVGTIGMAGVGVGAMAAGNRRDKKEEKERKKFESYANKAKNAQDENQDKPNLTVGNMIPTPVGQFTPPQIPIPLNIQVPTNSSLILQMDEEGNPILGSAPSNANASTPSKTFNVSDLVLSTDNQKDVPEPLTFSANSKTNSTKVKEAPKEPEQVVTETKIPKNK